VLFCLISHSAVEEQKWSLTCYNRNDHVEAMNWACRDYLESAVARFVTVAFSVLDITMEPQTKAE